MRLRLFNDIEARLSHVRLVNDKIIYHRPNDDENASFPGVPAIKHYALWNENTAQLTNARAFATPAIFVEFLPAVWSPLSRNAVHGDMMIRFHIITATLASTSDTAYRDEALMRFMLMRAVKSAFAGFAGKADVQGRSFSTFQYLESLTDHNHEQIIEDIEGWKTHCIDTADMLADGRILTPTDVTLDIGDIFDNQFASEMV